MRVVFLGSGSFAIPSLEAVLEAGVEQDAQQVEGRQTVAE